MSASIVPTVTLRPDGSLSVPVTSKASIVWKMCCDEVSGQPVLQIRVEQPGCKVYEMFDADSVALPVDL
jgi:hypothetical protein